MLAAGVDRADRDREAWGTRSMLPPAAGKPAGPAQRRPRVAALGPGAAQGRARAESPEVGGEWGAEHHKVWSMSARFRSEPAQVLQFPEP